MAKQETITSDVCRNGHPRNSDTTYINYRGEKTCKLCRYNRVSRYRTRVVNKLLNGNGDGWGGIL